MTDRIKAHLDGLMQGAPKTRRVEEMRQELLAGCLDKYADLTNGGMEPEAAYGEVIDGLGDVSELLGYIEKADTFDPVGAEEKRRKRAFFTSAGICCYFIALAAVVMFGYYGNGSFGAALFLIFCGIATMLIIYGRMTTVVKYEKTEDTLVEELKVQMSHGKKENKLAGMASSTLWSLTVVLYIVSSFITMRWDITWIMFLFASAAQCGITAWIYPDSRGKSLTGAFWCLAVAAYFIASFGTDAWHITWVIFPLAVALQQALRLFLYWRNDG